MTEIWAWLCEPIELSTGIVVVFALFILILLVAEDVRR